MKSKSFIVDWHIFPFQTIVCLGMNREAVLKKLKQIGYEPDDEELEQIKIPGTGRSLRLKGGQTILWTKLYPRAGSGVVAHEVFHVVDFLTEHLGITYSNNSDEIYAYMIEYFTNQITKNL